MQKGFTTLETRMRRDISATKGLTDLLGELKASIRRDSEANLRSLDELEKVRLFSIPTLLSFFFFVV